MFPCIKVGVTGGKKLVRHDNIDRENNLNHSLEFFAQAAFPNMRLGAEHLVGHCCYDWQEV